MAPLEFIHRVLAGFRKNQGFLLASAVAYNALLSMVPLFAVVLVLLSQFVEQDRLLRTVSDSVEQLLPGRAASITDQLSGFLAHGEVVGWMGGLSLLFFSSIAFTVLENAMGVIFHHRAVNRRNIILSAVLPYLFIMALGVGILLFTVLASALPVLDRGLRLAGASGALLRLGSALGLALLLTVIYLVMPVGRVSFRHALAGGVTAAILWELVRRVVAWFFTTLSMVNVVYGSLATTVVVLLTLEVAALILLLGAQVIAELERVKLTPESSGRTFTERSRTALGASDASVFPGASMVYDPPAGGTAPAYRSLWQRNRGPMSTRKSYEAKAESEFAQVQAQLSALAASAQKAIKEGRKEGEKLLLAAQSKHDEALHRFELLKRAGEDGWDGVKTSFETAWSELRQALGS
jgi:YihY family inner membrane protein